MLPQCGCPEGYSCKPLLDGGEVVRACIEPGTSALGELCSNVSHCISGYGCWGVTSNPTGEGACTPYCHTDANCPPETHCLDGYICFQACDPVTQQGCPSSLACIIGYSHDDTVAGGVCAPFGTAQPGDACTGWECAAGSYCISGTCYRFCDLGADDCPAGQCTPIDPPADFNGISYGVCV